MGALALETILEDLRNSQLWHETSIVREELEGTVDGINVVSRLPLAPALQSDGITIYASSGSVIPSTDYTVESWDAGVVVFTNPITVGYPTVSYTASEISQANGLNIVKKGYDELQSRYHRDWYLIASGGSTYISSTASPTITDPPTGDLTVSTSRRQRYALVLATEYALAQAKLRQESFHGGFMYRESMTSGVQVDRRQSVANLLSLIEHLDKALDGALDAALQEQSLDVSFGSYLPGATSETSARDTGTPYDRYTWWEDSDQGRGYID